MSKQTIAVVLGGLVLFAVGLRASFGLIGDEDGGGNGQTVPGPLAVDEARRVPAFRQAIGDADMAARNLVNPEVVSVIRRLTLAGRLTAERADSPGTRS